MLEMSNQVGYSPYYCSSRFHEIVGMTFKSYIAGRRLAMAALEIRDSDTRILDIAIKYGFSSQEALTRAFMSAFGCFYGFGVSDDYQGAVPDGFEVREFPASDYLVFFHPPFDYLKDCSEVMGKVERLAWNFDPHTKGYEWNEETCQDYQRHFPEVIGYEVLRPVRRIKN